MVTQLTGVEVPETGTMGSRKDQVNPTSTSTTLSLGCWRDRYSSPTYTTDLSLPPFLPLSQDLTLSMGSPIGFLGTT